MIALALLLARAAGAAGAGEPDSLFAQPWQWQDEHAKSVALDAWRGEPLVVAVAYTSCRVRCPLTVAKLRKVESAYAAAGKPAQFVLVTLDPANDSAARLAAYKRARKLPEANWHLLRGSLEQTRALLAYLNVRALDDGSHIDHDIKIFTFDGQGKLVRTFEGLGFDPAQAVIEP